ncbi:hypothetical protein ABZV64_29355 [Streptomyces sp. NPDC004959]|uniref:hypothetical protein n=1 Tax=unclassified Streptomyces TaxID=2593676 RepID=UPI0033A25308
MIIPKRPDGEGAARQTVESPGVVSLGSIRSNSDGGTAGSEKQADDTCVMAGEKGDGEF